MAGEFINIPSGARTWKDPVATPMALPANGNVLGDARVANSNSTIYVWDGSAWQATGGGGGSAVWGGITGTLSDQTDLESALDAKAPTNSPTFTGQLTAPDGVNSAPGVALNDPAMGLYYSGSDNSGFGWHGSTNTLGFSLSGTGGASLFQLVNVSGGIPLIGTPANSFAFACALTGGGMGMEIRIFKRTAFPGSALFLGNIGDYSGNTSLFGIEDGDYLSPFKAGWIGTGGLMLGEPGNFTTRFASNTMPTQLLDVRQKTVATPAGIVLTTQETGHDGTGGLLIDVLDVNAQVVNRSGELVLGGTTVITDASAGNTYQFATPSTGGTVSINNLSVVVVDPAGTLATLTVVLPASPVDTQRVRLGTSQIITALTLSPAAAETVKNAPSSLTAGGSFEYIYRSANTTWYKIG